MAAELPKEKSDARSLIEDWRLSFLYFHEAKIRRIFGKMNFLIGILRGVAASVKVVSIVGSVDKALNRDPHWVRWIIIKILEGTVFGCFFVLFYLLGIKLLPNYDNNWLDHILLIIGPWIMQLVSFILAWLCLYAVIWIVKAAVLTARTIEKVKVIIVDPKHTGQTIMKGSKHLGKTLKENAGTVGQVIGGSSEKIWTTMKPGMDRTRRMLRNQSAKTVALSKKTTQVSSQWTKENMPKAKESLKQNYQQVMEASKRGSKAAGKILAEGSTNTVSALKQSGKASAKFITNQSNQAAESTKKASGSIIRWAKNNQSKTKNRISAAIKASNRLHKKLSNRTKDHKSNKNAQK